LFALTKIIEDPRRSHLKATHPEDFNQSQNFTIPIAPEERMPEYTWAAGRYHKRNSACHPVLIGDSTDQFFYFFPIRNNQNI
jgi:hypothetical protein